MEDCKKDYQLLSHQRSSHNIGMLVGNTLGGMFKKAVELIESLEDQIMQCFTTERFAFCYICHSLFCFCDNQVGLFHHSDIQSNLILSHYDSVRDLKTVITNAKRVLQQYVLNESGVENSDLASLNQILNEITLFLQHNESFTRFFNGKMTDSWSVCEQNKKDTQAGVTPHTTVPQEMAAIMTAIKQKKLLPAGNKLQSFTVGLQLLFHQQILQSLYHSYTTLEEVFSVSTFPSF